MARTEILVEDVPEKIRDLVVAEAKHRDVSINEMAVGILAAAYGVEREPSGRGFRGETGSNQFLLAVPEELRTAIRMHAARIGSTQRGVVIEQLAKHFGIDAPPTDRRRRTAAA